MAEPLKNAYNTEFIDKLGTALLNVDYNFDQSKFESLVFNSKWKGLELKERMSHITECIHESLPYNLEKQIDILSKVVNQFDNFTAFIFPNFVEIYCINNFDLALRTLKEFTKYSTSEFAIRPFILQNQEKSMAFLLACARDENFHVRRWASEGCRPLLPWSFKLVDFVKDPTPILTILELLKDDSEDYVYRSVANNLNDISKSHPDLVINICQRWMRNPTDNSFWVVKHALRTLLKKGNSEALKLIGIDQDNQLEILELKTTDKLINFGGSTRLIIELKNNKKSNTFRIEYIIDYLKSNGKHSPKVFQVKECEIKKNATIKIDKKLDFKELTTRKHYKGEHFISLKVNGVESEKISFTLI
jgi:3-methyladenine DNA glycosylase AlkC